jgi:hypothetical protein
MVFAVFFSHFSSKTKLFKHTKQYSYDVLFLFHHKHYQWYQEKAQPGGRQQITKAEACGRHQ